MVVLCVVDVAFDRVMIAPRSMPELMLDIIVLAISTHVKRTSSAETDSCQFYDDFQKNCEHK